MNATPVTLLRRVSTSHDPLDWREFVDILLPLMSKWVARLQLAEQEAADLIQDVFVVLLKELPGFQYDPNRSFRAWLWTILKRRAIDSHRRQPPQPLEANAEPVTDDVPLLDETEFRTELMSRALAIVQTEFAPATWRAFWGHVVEGRAVNDVADELGIAPGSVYVAKGRVMTVLKDRLRDMLD